MLVRFAVLLVASFFLLVKAEDEPCDGEFDAFFECMEDAGFTPPDSMIGDDDGALNPCDLCMAKYTHYVGPKDCSEANEQFCTMQAHCLDTCIGKNNPCVKEALEFLVCDLDDAVGANCDFSCKQSVAF